MNKQREIIYKRRLEALEGEDLGDECHNLVGDIAAATVEEHTVEAGSDYADDWDLLELRHEFGRRLGVDLDFEHLSSDGSNAAALKELGVKAALDRYAEREEAVGPVVYRQFERFVTLTTIDANWKDHLYSLDRLREGIGLRAYGQKDPLLEYKKEAFQLFSDLMDRIDLQTAERLMKTEIRAQEAPPPQPVGVAHRPEVVGAGVAGGAQAPAGGQAPPAPRAARRPAAGGPALPPSGMPSGNADKFKNAGRNDPCPCGSGKKFKKCHGRNA